jgi:hypothetical protein
MKVDYDPEASSLLIEFDGSGADDTEDVAGGVCLVGHCNGDPKWIQLLAADRNVAALDEAAERFGLDAEGLRAAARAAFAAPGREITIEVGKRLPLSDEEEPERARAA